MKADPCVVAMLALVALIGLALLVYSARADVVVFDPRLPPPACFENCAASCGYTTRPATLSDVVTLRRALAGAPLP